VVTGTQRRSGRHARAWTVGAFPSRLAPLLRRPRRCRGVQLVAVGPGAKR